ncbi:hypothetical protein F4779DRAFT_615905 [Xylariaceae sp. FL0662B]|nr:hypothetical protein F4779DRAFT_615905 [Xylariaceae sp. FL0662B]
MTKKGTNKAPAPIPPESTVESSPTKDIRQPATRSHETALPPKSVYERYVDGIENVVDAVTVVEVIGRLLKESGGKGYQEPSTSPTRSEDRPLEYHYNLIAERTPLPALDTEPSVAANEDEAGYDVC